MAAIPIGIDLCHNPLRVGCKIANSVLVQEGSKGVNLKCGQKSSKSGLPPTMVENMEDIDEKDFEKLANRNRTQANNNITASPELVHCFEDARSVAKSFFGSPHIKNAVVVVPNDTDVDAWRSIEPSGNRASVRVLQVIPEHLAVAAAYADKTKPTKTSMITIISSTSGVCDVYVVSISPKLGMSYEYTVQNRGSHSGEPVHETYHHGKEKSEGIFGSVANIMTNINNVTFEGNPITRSLELEVENFLRTDKEALEKVVFVGKSAELEKMREIINKGFAKIKEWKEVDDSEQLAAYGAAVLASLGEPI